MPPTRHRWCNVPLAVSLPAMLGATHSTLTPYLAVPLVMLALALTFFRRKRQ
jgi:hypothetical protein